MDWRGKTCEWADSSFSPSFVSYNCISKMLYSDWLGFCWNHTNMHSYKPWLKNYSYVIAITHSLPSRHCSVSYLYQCKCIVLYVQFFWDSIMKWRGFINNNNNKITVTFYVYVLLLKAVLKKTEVSGQKTLYYWMIIMDLPELYPEF